MDVHRRISSLSALSKKKRHNSKENTTILFFLSLIPRSLLYLSLHLFCLPLYLECWRREQYIGRKSRRQRGEMEKKTETFRQMRERGRGNHNRGCLSPSRFRLTKERGNTSADRQSNEIKVTKPLLRTPPKPHGVHSHVSYVPAIVYGRFAAV